eukprot:9518988-Alexandrium_andersonii.AAC.1
MCIRDSAYARMRAHMHTCTHASHPTSTIPHACRSGCVDARAHAQTQTQTQTQTRTEGADV